MFSRFDTILKFDGLTDGQADGETNRETNRLSVSLMIFTLNGCTTTPGGRLLMSSQSQSHQA